MSSIVIKDLQVAIGDKEIIRGLNFEFSKGEMHAIMGPNGSGKSTLLRTLVGLERPSGGEVWIKGVNIAKASASELDRFGKFCDITLAEIRDITQWRNMWCIVLLKDRNEVPG